MEGFRVLVLAAGKGTRMKSDLPKVVHKLSGESMISRVVNASKKAGAEDVVVVVGYKSDIVKKELVSYDIKYANQYEQLGTGHAVIMAKEYFNNYNGYLVIISGDVPLITSKTIKNIYEYTKKMQNDCTIATALLDDPAAYGRIITDANGNVKKIVEAKDATPEEYAVKEINTGIYCFNSSKLFDALSNINTNNKQGEYYLTDTIEIILNNSGRISTFAIESEHEFKGVNTVEQLKELEKFV